MSIIVTYLLATTLKLLRVEVSNIDHLATMQYSAGKPRHLYGCYLTHKTQPNIFSKYTPHGNSVPSSQGSPQQENPPCHTTKSGTVPRVPFFSSTKSSCCKGHICIGCLKPNSSQKHFDIHEFQSQHSFSSSLWLVTSKMYLRLFQRGGLIKIQFSSHNEGNSTS